MSGLCLIRTLRHVYECSSIAIGIDGSAKGLQVEAGGVEVGRLEKIERGHGAEVIDHRIYIADAR